MTPEIKILEIREHMQQQANSNDPDVSLEKQHQKIHRNGIIRMQEMESYAVPGRIEYRICKKVVQVYKHSGQQDKIRPEPGFPVEHQGNKNRKDQVQEIMNKGFPEKAVGHIYIFPFKYFWRSGSSSFSMAYLRQVLGISRQY